MYVHVHDCILHAHQQRKSEPHGGQVTSKSSVDMIWWHKQYIIQTSDRRAI